MSRRVNMLMEDANDPNTRVIELIKNGMPPDD